MIRARQCLLAMGWVVGVIEVEHKGGGGLRGAGDAVVDQCAREPVEILAVDAVFKTGKGRGARQVLRGIQGGPLHAELQQGVVPETIGIIAIRIPRGDLGDTRGQEVSEGMIYLGLMSLVLHGSGKACGETNLAVDATQ
jgi:hypothetical protein